MGKGKPDPNWKEKVKAWESSNQNPRVWCKKNQIPYTTLLGWRDRLRKKDNNKLSIEPKMNFIELKDQTQSDPRIVLEYYGVKIQLKHEFDKIVLKECLHCLRGAFLLSIAGNARIFFFQKPVDMRKGVESLSVLIEQ